jgi:hypothetical protein
MYDKAAAKGKFGGRCLEIRNDGTLRLVGLAAAVNALIERYNDKPVPWNSLMDVERDYPSSELLEFALAVRGRVRGRGTKRSLQPEDLEDEEEEEEEGEGAQPASPLDPGTPSVKPASINYHKLLDRGFERKRARSADPQGKDQPTDAPSRGCTCAASYECDTGGVCERCRVFYY